MATSPIGVDEAMGTWLRATRPHMADHARGGLPPVRDCPRCQDLLAYFDAVRAHYGDALSALLAPRPDPRRGRLAAVLETAGILPPGRVP